MATADFGSHFRIRKVGGRKFKPPTRAPQKESHLRFGQDEVVAFFMVVFVVCCGAYVMGLLLGGQTIP